MSNTLTIIWIKEEVARIVSRYDIMAVPVVDRNHRLVGIVTVDDVLDVIQEETTEDVFRMAGVHEDELEEDDSVPKMIWGAVEISFAVVVRNAIWRHFIQHYYARIGVGTGSRCGFGIFYTASLRYGEMLAPKVPIVTVRGLSTGQISKSGFFATVLKESSVGLIVGLFCAVILAVVAWVWQGSAILGILLGITPYLQYVYCRYGRDCCSPGLKTAQRGSRCGVSALYQHQH